MTDWKLQLTWAVSLLLAFFWGRYVERHTKNA